ncbi:MAG TPA: hypothetical protein DD730_03100 [Desulfosporosinus sp.]|nr:hypothetical protein [Desulfosporosinus sp.]
MVRGVLSMCGRFSIAGFEGIEERFQLKIAFPDLKPNYNVDPSQDVPVIRNRGANQLAFFKWGLIPFWAKDPYKLLWHKKKAFIFRLRANQLIHELFSLMATLQTLLDSDSRIYKTS